MTGDFCVVLITAPDANEAGRIAQALLEEKHAACVNVVGGVQSRYWWKGRIEQAAEVLLIVKTRKSKLDGLEACVKARHSYSVPEVIALPIIAGSRPYLDWVAENLP